MTKSPWTPERVAMLRQMRLVQGLSCLQCAKALSLTGHKFTRNAVVAKCDRLGLASPEARNLTRAQHAKALGRKPQPPAVVDRSSEKGAPRSDTNVRFIDKADWQCQMFVGGESHDTGLICGAMREGEKPYCKACAKLAYEPITPPKRRAA